MKYEPLRLSEDLSAARAVAEAAFSSTPDSSLEQWFSFEEMEKQIQEGRGVCMKATNDSEEIVGITYAQQESPINGAEGVEKWVIILAAVVPEAAGSGVGTELLQIIETAVKERGAIKMFVYTNEDDQRVIHFYEKNGYENAGEIRDYQYGKGNDAVFLLKYL